MSAEVVRPTSIEARVPVPDLLLPGGQRDLRAVPARYAGVRITAAVDLLRAREFQNLPREERLRKALGEQQTFLAGLLASGTALDLRMLVHPGRPNPLDIAVLARVYGERAADPGSASGLVRQMLALMPRHVEASGLDAGGVEKFLRPFPARQSVDSAVVTRRELVSVPTRRDAGVAYYYTVVPFAGAEVDWTALYTALAATEVPTVVSVALLPITVPLALSQLLTCFATFYGRMAQEDYTQPGLYLSARRLAPEAFAVDALEVFRDYARRYQGAGFAMRIQVTSAPRIPAGLAETVAATVAGVDRGSGTYLDRRLAPSDYEIRRPSRPWERDLARWNLEAVDFGLLPGAPAIWQRPDPPDPLLAVLPVLADARDAAAAFRLPVAVDGTVPGFAVSAGAFGHVQPYETAGEALLVGTLPGQGGALRFPVDRLTQHALVCGAPGSGKSTTVRHLLRQLWRNHRVPFLVIEPVNAEANDYRPLMAEPGFEEMEVYTVGDERGRPLRFNPFEVPAGVLVLEHQENLLACFKAAFGLWEPLPAIYQRALSRMYLDAGILATETAGDTAHRWPTAADFSHSMREVTSELEHVGEVRSNIEAASLIRAQQLVTGATASTFLTDRPNDIARLLDRPVMVELKSLGSGDQQALMMALLLNALTEHYQSARGASGGLRHVTVVEEAHRLLARPSGGKAAEEAQAKEKAAEAFANSLAENRKYGEGILIAEQVPSKLVADAVKNTNLKIMHRLTSEEDVRYVGTTMNLDDAQLTFAARLQTGEAVVYSDAYSDPARVTVPRPPQGTRAPRPRGEPAPPFAACAPCRVPCEFRGASLALVQDPRTVEQFKDIVLALQRDDLTQDEVADSWANLIESLRDRVRAIPSLPQQGTPLDDAAYCLFVHSQAVRTSRLPSEWPQAVAEELGVAPRPAG